VLRHCAAHPGGDEFKGLVPRCRAELGVTFAAGADERRQDPIGAVDPIEQSVDLRAQFALRVRVRGVASQFDRDATFNRHLPPATVRAVVMAGPKDGADGHPLSLSGDDVSPATI